MNRSAYGLNPSQTRPGDVPGLWNLKSKLKAQPAITAPPLHAWASGPHST